MSQMAWQPLNSDKKGNPSVGRADSSALRSILSSILSFLSVSPLWDKRGPISGSQNHGNYSIVHQSVHCGTKGARLRVGLKAPPMVLFALQWNDWKERHKQRTLFEGMKWRTNKCESLKALAEQLAKRKAVLELSAQADWGVGFKESWI